MVLEDIVELAIHVVLSKLGPNDAAVVACVSRRFKIWASHDHLWSKFCADDLNLSSPLDHLGNPTSSFMEAYQAWRGAFGMYPWPLVKRAKRCWATLKDWLAVKFPEVLTTLRKGATEEEINMLEKHLKVKLPLPTRVLYRFCDGQDFTNEGVLESLLGVIGGYSLYEHLVNVFLLPLSEVIEETNKFICNHGFRNRSKFIVVAASSTYDAKMFLLNCNSGQLYVGTKNLIDYGEMLPCVPSALISSVHDCNGSQQQDAMLLWLEEHGRRLQSDMIKVREEGKVKSINLFPEQSPLCSTAVTNRVQVRASGAFIPELSDLKSKTEKYFFAYSIRMCLLPDGCFINGIFFESCQLHSRHWIICADDVVICDFRGEGVIGKFPLLCQGEKEFVYESCTTLPSSSGSIEGGFTFVPGRLAKPKGGPFKAEVARYPLHVPDYIF